MYEKLLYEKFLSGIGWFINMNPKYKWCQGFKAELKETMEKITLDMNKPQSNRINDENFMDSKEEEGWKTVQEKREKLEVPGFLLAICRVCSKHAVSNYQTSSIKIQTNRTDAVTMKKIMSKYHKYNKSIKFVPFGLDKQRPPVVYANLIQEQNCFLRNNAMVPVFGLH